MNVEIGAEATLFPEKEYINGIAVAVYPSSAFHHFSCYWDEELLKARLYSGEAALLAIAEYN